MMDDARSTSPGSSQEDMAAVLLEGTPTSVATQAAQAAAMGMLLRTHPTCQTSTPVTDDSCGGGKVRFRQTITNGSSTPGDGEDEDEEVRRPSYRSSSTFPRSNNSKSPVLPPLPLGRSSSKSEAKSEASFTSPQSTRSVASPARKGGSGAASVTNRSSRYGGSSWSRPSSRRSSPSPSPAVRRSSTASAPGLSPGTRSESDDDCGSVYRCKTTPHSARSGRMPPAMSQERILEDLRDAIDIMKEQKGHKVYDSIKTVSAAIFKLIDEKNDGLLNRPEFNRFCQMMAEQCSMFTSDAADFHSVDTDGDRSIDEKEFYAFMKASYRMIGRRKFLAELGMIGQVLQPPSENGEDIYRDLRCGQGCIIEETAHRGITLPQLRTLLQHMRQRCPVEGWTDIGEFSPFRGTSLASDALNLYHTVDWVIKPATRPRGCSYVEFVGQGPQIPKWFVSHFWGEPVADFITCLTQHAFDHMLPEDSPYWVCAYANNQWDLKSDLGISPETSSFRKAMEIADGTVSILDHNAECWNRVWCCYEVWVSIVKMRGKSYKYDMYTTLEDLAVGITDGCAERDLLEEYPLDEKQKRQSRFPVKICERALSIRLQDAKSTNDMDRRCILNSIIGYGPRRLKEVPPKEHSRYEELNDLLSGIVASSTWRDALEGGLDMEPYKNALMKCDLPKLEVSFDSCRNITDSSVQDILSTVSSGLEELDIDLSFCEAITNQTLANFAEAMMVPKALKRISLSFMTAVKRDSPLTDDGLRALARALKGSSMQEVILNFHGCKVLTDSGVCDLFDSFPRTLSRVEVDMAFNPNISSLSVVNFAGRMTTSLSALKLNLHSCSIALTANALKILARALPPNLRELNLDVRSCEDIDDQALSTLFTCLHAYTPSLRSLVLNCSFCTKLGDGAAPTGFASHLEALNLSFQFCTKITDYMSNAIANALPGTVQDLYLNFSGCTNLTAQGAFVPLAKALPSALRNFELNISEVPCAKRAEQIIEKRLEECQGIRSVIHRSDRMVGTLRLQEELDKSRTKTPPVEGTSVVRLPSIVSS